MDRDIENPKSTWSTAFHPVLGEKNGELWSTNQTVIGAPVDPPTGLFSEDYISAPRERWPLKFLHALDTDQDLLAHTTNRVGVPQKILRVNIWNWA